MWIASRYGFFSVVRKDDREKGSGYVWLVRARRRGDLERLRAATGLSPAIVESPVADYRYRIVVRESGREAVFGALEDSVDYENFKDTIHDDPDQDEKSRIYSDWWYDMFKYQRDIETVERLEKQTGLPFGAGIDDDDPLEDFFGTDWRPSLWSRDGE